MLAVSDNEIIKAIEHYVEKHPQTAFTGINIDTIGGAGTSFTQFVDVTTGPLTFSDWRNDVTFTGGSTLTHG